MKIHTFFVASSFLLLAIFSTDAQTTITFDGSELMEGDSVTNQFDGITVDGAILVLPGHPILGFRTGPVGPDALYDEIDPPMTIFEGPSISDELINGGFTVPGTIGITFAVPASNITCWVADIDINEILTVDGFDPEENHLGRVEWADGCPSTGDGIATFIELPWDNVGRVEFFCTNPNNSSGWGIDTVSYFSKVILGDVNCDGQVDLLDVAPFVDALTNGELNAKADINQDGSVDLLDVAPFVSLLSGN